MPVTKVVLNKDYFTTSLNSSPLHLLSTYSHSICHPCTGLCYPNVSADWPRGERGSDGI